jgi:hypothetical protein
MTAQVADTHAHVQRLVSVFKMATVFKGSTTEEQRYFILFCGQKDSMERIFIKNVSCLGWEVFVA